MTLHGGKISVRSAGLGKGTTFTVVLPVIKINDEDDGNNIDIFTEHSQLDSSPGKIDVVSPDQIISVGTTVHNSRVLKRLLVVDDSLPNR